MNISVTRDFDSLLNPELMDSLAMYDVEATGAELVAATRKIADETAATAAAEVDERGRFPSASLQRLAGEGFFGLIVPEELGGHGQSPSTFAAVVEELAQACSSQFPSVEKPAAGIRYTVITPQFRQLPFVASLGKIASMISNLPSRA